MSETLDLAPYVRVCENSSFLLRRKMFSVWASTLFTLFFHIWIAASWGVWSEQVFPDLSFFDVHEWFWACDVASLVRLCDFLHCNWERECYSWGSTLFSHLCSLLRSFWSVWLWRDHKVYWKCLYGFWATFFILYILLPCSSHKWRRSIPSLIGNFHSDLRAIYLLRGFLIPVVIMLSLQQGIRSWNIVNFFWNLLSTPYILFYSFIGGSMRTLSSKLIFDESYTSIIHSLTALSSTTLSFSAYFSVNWLPQNSKLASGSADT